MASAEIEEVPVLSSTHSQILDKHMNGESQRPTSRNQSLSASVPLYSRDEYVSENHVVSHTGPLLLGERGTPLSQMCTPSYNSRRSGKFDSSLHLAEEQISTIVNVEGAPLDATDQRDWPDDKLVNKNEHLLRSGKLGMCSYPYCSTCPTYYNYGQAWPFYTSEQVHYKFSGGAKGWMRRPFSFLSLCIFGIMNPHAKAVQQWNKVFKISCLVAIFVDPLTFFLLSVQKENKCIVFDWSMAIGVAVVRSITDFIYLCHMLLQFRVAFVPPDSTVVGGELVSQPKKIAFHYLRGKFFVDVFAVLPLLQILIFVSHGLSNTKIVNYLTSLLVSLQMIPRFYGYKSLLDAYSEHRLTLETASRTFFRNLLTCVLTAHLVGSWWYISGIQRVHQCLWHVCHTKADPAGLHCENFLYCEYKGNINNPFPTDWEKRQEDIFANCFEEKGNFSYGIYEKAVELTAVPGIVTRYTYSFFWGLQQISTLAGNQVPSYNPWEILFLVWIVFAGLFIFSQIVGDVLNSFHALGQRRYEIQRRGTDVEQWMRNKRLPKPIKRKVRQSERFYWASTQGVNEEALLKHLPEDLQREIHLHLFSFIKKVQMFAQMEDQMLDAICARLKPKLYTKGSKMLHVGCVVDKMFFIVRGIIISKDAHGNGTSWPDRDFCGEEILSWWLKHFLLKKDGQKIRALRRRSSRTVTCLTNVETYSLHASNLDEIAAIFPKFWRRLKSTVSPDSRYWRGFAATSIQVAWRYRMQRLRRGEISTHESK